MTFFISVGAWALLPHFFAAFIPFVSLGMGRCAEEDGSLPFAFGSLCAHLAAFNFEKKARLNAGGFRAGLCRVGQLTHMPMARWAPMQSNGARGKQSHN